MLTDGMMNGIPYDCNCIPFYGLSGTRFYLGTSVSMTAVNLHTINLLVLRMNTGVVENVAVDMAGRTANAWSWLRGDFRELPPLTWVRRVGIYIGVGLFRRVEVSSFAVLARILLIVSGSMLSSSRGLQYVVHRMIFLVVNGLAEAHHVRLTSCPQ